MGLRGATIVVTGAARGIGLTVVQACAERGAKVAMVDVLEDELAKSAYRMAVEGHAVLPIIADVSDPASVETMVGRVEAELGRMDALVNNAATFSYVGPL